MNSRVSNQCSYTIRASKLPVKSNDSYYTFVFNITNLTNLTYLLWSILSSVVMLFSFQWHALINE